MTLLKLFLLLFVALMLEALGVVFLSQGLRQIGELQQINLVEIARLIGRGVTNGRILLGVFMEAIFFALLLIMLRSWDVSLIWPLTSLGFVLTTLAARFLRHEEVNAMRWAGVFLIMAGAAMVGYSEVLKKPASKQSGSVTTRDESNQHVRQPSGG
jgi:drug/metabolite transporter (DMT)-like permease